MMITKLTSLHRNTKTGPDTAATSTSDQQGLQTLTGRSNIKHPQSMRGTQGIEAAA